MLALMTVVVAQLFDFGTFVEMVRRVGVGAEMNPLVATLFNGYGTPAVALAKAALVLLVVSLAVATMRSSRRVRVAAGTLPVGLAIVAGLIGGISNALVLLH